VTNFINHKKHWPQKLTAVLPHEWVFNAFLLLTGLRLCVHGGAARGWTLVFWGCLLADLWVFFWAERSQTV
jgi:hypothetical protein